MVHHYLAGADFSMGTCNGHAMQAGPRICVGKDSAMLQLRIALATVCRFFTFEVVPGTVVKYRQMSTLLLANGLPVKVAKRSLD